MAEIFVFGAHFYDPPRRTYHEMFRHVPTDPQGKNWLVEVYNRAYGPLMRSGVLDRMSYDINQVLLHEMRRNGLAADGFKIGKADNVIGTSYIHPLLPDLADDDKRIVVGAGYESYRRDFGKNPTIFWAPEAAMDEATARILLEFGYQALVCAPWQIQTADGRPADNRPHRIGLPGARSIIAIPYDRELSQKLAFGDKSNADRFRDEFVRPKTAEHQMLVTWTDGETYGHHAPFADWFLYHFLIHSLPEINVHPTPINQIDFTRMNLPWARLHNRTAWSCHCGDLARWHQGCGCSNGADASWKAGFYDTFKWLNEAITKIVAPALGRNYVAIMRAGFERAFVNPGGRFTRPEESLQAAKVDALTARTSCGTFFHDPHTAGRINIVFGLEAIQHIRDAGMATQADRLEAEFMQRLQRITDPVDRSRTLADLTNMMLSQQVAKQPVYSLFA